MKNYTEISRFCNDYFSAVNKLLHPEFNDEVQKGRSIGPSTIATKTCIVCLPQLQNTGASLWKVITQKPQKSIYTCPLLNEKKYLGLPKKVYQAAKPELKVFLTFFSTIFFL